MEGRTAHVRASLERIFAERLSPERTRRPTLTERLTVRRLGWATVARMNRWLELLGRIATVVWAAFMASILLGLPVKETVADALNGGRPVRAAVAIALLTPTIIFFLAHSVIGWMRWRLQRELWRRDVERLQAAADPGQLT